jgi:CO/xanthine dehydrogenase Mo-binding subunit
MKDEIPGGVGASLPRLEIAEKVTGAAQYIADLYRPNMLHAAIVQSTVAHARITGYDTEAARAIPGVVAVLTGEDFPDGRMGAFIKDEHAIAKDRIRYMGEPVAVVAAETEEIARRAAQAVVVQVEELPRVDRNRIESVPVKVSVQFRRAGLVDGRVEQVHAAERFAAQGARGIGVNIVDEAQVLVAGIVRAGDQAAGVAARRQITVDRVVAEGDIP